jgi:hypothetical protein
MKLTDFNNYFAIHSNSPNDKKSPMNSVRNSPTLNLLNLNRYKSYGKS